MKNIAIVLCLMLVPLYSGIQAQSSLGEPSEESVLQTARDNYNSSQTQSDGDATQTYNQPTELSQPAGTVIININSNETTVQETKTEAPPPAREVGSSGTVQDQPRQYPFSPFVIGFVPGLSFPFGTYTTNLAVGAIGSSVGGLYGIQTAGIFSTAAAPVIGVQASGIFNTASASFGGIQSAGIFNVVQGDMGGIQSAGIFNHVGGHMRGIQTAGILNTSGSFSGVQVSGVINQTGKGKGLMIGLVNVADELDGIAIGLVNNIKNGVRDVAIDYQFINKMMYLTYRSGTPMLYAVAYVGEVAPEIFTEADATRSAGFGLGHRFTWGFLTMDAELAYEVTNMGQTIEFLDDLYGYAAYGHELICESYGYGSARFSFGFGSRRGAGIYFGIKADFGDYLNFSVPEHLRYELSKDERDGTNFFGRVLPVWPKWFMGFKF
ncbi:MAG: hypothetical protein KKC64_16250 [Spirochaetes bacterium]|nr:hypothetical protein [Spirochaetota bacterium]